MVQSALGGAESVEIEAGWTSIRDTVVEDLGPLFFEGPFLILFNKGKMVQYVVESMAHIVFFANNNGAM